MYADTVHSESVDDPGRRVCCSQRPFRFTAEDNARDQFAAQQPQNSPISFPRAAVLSPRCVAGDRARVPLVFDTSGYCALWLSLLYSAGRAEALPLLLRHMCSAICVAYA